MGRCPKCGADAYGFIDASGAGIYKCGSTDEGFDPEHPEPFVSDLCLRRQLAAANERVAELAELWKIVKDEALDEYAVTLPHVAMAVSAIDRILGGGK